MKRFDLVGIDGNAFSVMGYVAKAMRRAGFNRMDIDKYYEDAKSSDYQHLLMVSVMMIDKVNDTLEEQGLLDEDEDF